MSRVQSSNRHARPTISVGIVGYGRANLLDISGPLQVFTTAREQLSAAGLHEEAYRVCLLSTEGAQITTTAGVTLPASPLPQGGGGFDTLIVAGGYGFKDAMRDEQLTGWIRQNSGRWRRTGSVCTGSFVLAAAGLLEGRRAATHWDYCQEMADQYPRTEVDRNAIFVEHDAVWTSAGVSSGMDMALAMVEADWGRATALLVAKRLVLFLKRPGGQTQFSVALQAQSSDGRLASLLNWIVENPGADLRIENLSERAGMSERTLHRAFVEETGRSPADFIEEVRVENARRLLEDSDLDVAVVALRAGFRSAEQLRRAMLRRHGVTPADYRARFTSSRNPDDPGTVLALRRLN